MSWLRSSMLLLAACAPAALHTDRTTEFSRAIDAEIAEARQELLATGDCTHRVSSPCAKGFAISESDGFVGSIEYFDTGGRSVGTVDFSCLSTEEKGVSLRCDGLHEEFLCPRALAQLQRVEATIHFCGKDVQITRDTEFDATEFRGTVGFSADPLQPLTFTVTAIAADVDLNALLLLDRLEGMQRQREGRAMPAEEVIQVGDAFVLPSRLRVGSTSKTLSVTSRYAPR